MTKPRDKFISYINSNNPKGYRLGDVIKHNTSGHPDYMRWTDIPRRTGIDLDDLNYFMDIPLLEVTCKSELRLALIAFTAALDISNVRAWEYVAIGLGYPNYGTLLEYNPKPDVLIKRVDVNQEYMAAVSEFKIVPDHRCLDLHIPDGRPYRDRLLGYIAGSNESVCRFVPDEDIGYKVIVPEDVNITVVELASITRLPFVTNISMKDIYSISKLMRDVLSLTSRVAMELIAIALGYDNYNHLRRLNKGTMPDIVHMDLLNLV